ncbi:GDSL-type esterase/lipase family protein [Liquorilactobacillus mali]|uniref:Esterase n=1 Tax=Liquorilactobacillus mali TaxID=1618 RepID=A0A0R2FP63_9LACO|nr:GDSL-type esterase/lipase family protein [Liquorilactobacillus mali]KRN26732.1 esterase [Liquorilactobacillus mali]
MNIHLTGDSLIARYEGHKQPIINEILKELKDKLSITNTACPGDNTADILTRMKADILSSKKADKIFILIGTNDIALNKQIGLEQFGDNLTEIIKQLCTVYESNEIYFITPSPVDEQKQQYRTNKLIRKYAAVIVKVAESMGCYTLDLYQKFIEYGQLSLNELLHGVLDDGLHFGEEGYRILAELIVQVL